MSPARYTLPLFLLFAQTASGEALRGSLFHSTPVATRVTASGLFVGRAPGGLFADLPAHEPAFAQERTARIKGTGVTLIRALIQEAESRRDGYDAVQHGARVKPRKRPTQMTIEEIFDWVDATPGQPHAIGRYQFIPKTLRRVVARAGIATSQRFSARPTVGYPAGRSRAAPFSCRHAGAARIYEQHGKNLGRAAEFYRSFSL